MSLQLDKAIVKQLETDPSMDGYYIGIKNTDVISLSKLQNKLSEGYIFHTIDTMSDFGRAIDLNLINPITGRFMTGSSSGSAINVFLNINDIAIATDGGGSVLAPALSLNLYGFISPLLDDFLSRKDYKKSTDLIDFYPSIGLISKNFNTLRKCIKDLIDLKDEKEKQYQLIIGKSPVVHHDQELGFKSESLDLSYEGLNRKKMIEELKSINFNNKILITSEGPIDLLGYGDSILGHYDQLTQNIQKEGHKYYLKVVNMLNLSAIICPTHKHATGHLIIFESTLDALHQALRIAESFCFKRSTIEENYFTKFGKEIL